MKNSILYAFLLVLVVAGCSKDAETTGNNAASPTAKAGSLARFVMVGNYLYVANPNSLQVYQVTGEGMLAEQPSVYINNIGMVETIFPFRDKLFLGGTAGMSMFSLQNPAAPAYIGAASHLRSCDPVVSNDSIAFISLKGVSACGPAEAGLYIHRITANTDSLPLIRFMSISTPVGLGLEGNILYLAREEAGLSIINVSNPSQPQVLNTITGYNFKDVITYDGLLIAQLANGIALYEISDPASPQFIKLVAN